MEPTELFTAFEETRCILAAGPLAAVALAAHGALEADPLASIVVLSDETGRVVDLDLRGSAKEVKARYAASRDPASPDGAARRGRPPLGVVSREVTLLPRHWDWLASRPGGASVTLRKLVEEASRGSAGPDRLRRAKEAAYRVMSVLAGNLPGYEEALRSLFAGTEDRFVSLTEPWPADIRSHVRRLAAGAFT